MNMKLKTRPTIAFCAVILVPIVLCGAVMLGFSQYQIKAIEKTYDIDFSIETFSNSIQIISKSTERVREELQEMAFLQLLFYFIGKCVIEEI